MPVRLDGRTLFLWWGQDRDDNDCLATHAGRLQVADSEIGIRSAAALHRWQATAPKVQYEQVTDFGQNDAEGVRVIDVDEVRDWLSHPGRAVPVAAGLNVWNFATDVAYTFGRARADRGYWVDRSYDKLFAANVPWAFGLESYRPRWTRQELTALRRVQGDVVGLLRSMLTVSYRPARPAA
ncbi:hypothetical protein [Kineococcus rubinsiae]|uniref:hypothetical protein n=1 Tax=Kineococcus rubinsiae TaxID=2609562 RepID=UPI001430A40A|nr:hypothetical protein [Kineococcus rubinsiae]NIZ90274.1 hypothetical protein [Kineococcus rubinsiae]